MRLREVEALSSDQQRIAPKVPEFDCFVAIDWSGAKSRYLAGIAIAEARPGAGAPVLVPPPNGRRWSRYDVLVWLSERLAQGQAMLVGFDLSPGFPFVDRNAYFPLMEGGPLNARDLWRFVEERTAKAEHLGVNPLFDDPLIAAHFRIPSRAVDPAGFGRQGRGRLRVVENSWLESGNGSPYSCFNLVGAAQVGKSSLTGMRLFHRLEGHVPIWPFYQLPSSGSVLVEIYTTVAARDAGLGKGRSKITDSAALDKALDQLDSAASASLDRYLDHWTDAIVSAAWLRKVHRQPELWQPVKLTPEIARTEGWTFGIG